jgi:hypothetical protein
MSRSQQSEVLADLVSEADCLSRGVRDSLGALGMFNGTDAAVVLCEAQHYDLDLQDLPGGQSCSVWSPTAPDHSNGTATAFELLTSEQRTPEVCLAAVRQDAWVIQHLTDEQRTPEVCLEAVRAAGWTVDFLAPQQRTPEVCLEAVRKDAWALRCLSDAQRSPEVCLAAVTSSGSAVQFLNAEQRTPAVCDAAVHNEPHAIEYLDVQQRTGQVCLAAVRQHGLVIKYLSAEQRSPEVCMAALANCSSAILYLSAQECALAPVCHWVEANWSVCVAELGLERAEEVGRAVLIALCQTVGICANETRADQGLHCMRAPTPHSRHHLCGA